MSRIETVGDATLYLGDCREILPTLGKVDAVVTDPPYLNLQGGTVHSMAFSGVARKRMVSTAVGDEWAATTEWVPLAEALARKAVAVFCSHACVADFKNAFTLAPVSLAVWHKRNAPPAVNNVPRQTTEFVWLFRAGPNADWRSIKDTLFSVNSANAGCVSTGERLVDLEGRALHPTQKPVAIMEPFVGLVAPGETVLDPFMGSGTTGVAAAKMGRRFVGVEISPEYFDIACRRIEEAWKQPRLFAEPTPPPTQGALSL